jgi:tRNA(fMet)-specific endonuclease VapC
VKKAILDSNTLSELIKRKNKNIVRHAVRYVRIMKRFAIASVSIYEVRRWLLLKKATSQLESLDGICHSNDILELNQPVLDIATELWVDSRRRGLVSDDADLFIAATALHHHYRLISGNTTHFDWIPNLDLEDWQLE